MYQITRVSLRRGIAWYGRAYIAVCPGLPCSIPCSAAVQPVHGRPPSADSTAQQLRGRGSAPQQLQGSTHMDPVRAAGARGAALRAPAARLMASDAAAVHVLRGGRWPVAKPCRGCMARAAPCTRCSMAAQAARGTQLQRGRHLMCM